MPFGHQNPTSWVVMSTIGRNLINRISRDVRIRYSALDEDGSDLTDLLQRDSTAASAAKPRRTMGKKHKDKRSRDYVRHWTHSQSDSDFSNDSCSNYTKNARPQKATKDGDNGPSDDPIISSDSISSARTAIDALRRVKKLQSQRAPRYNDWLHISKRGDYKSALNNDLTGHQPWNSKSTAVVSAKNIFIWWKEDGTKWKGPTYDSKYPFNG